MTLQPQSKVESLTNLCSSLAENSFKHAAKFEAIDRAFLEHQNTQVFLASPMNYLFEVHHKFRRQKVSILIKQL